MNTLKAEVIQAVKLRPGTTLDGRTVAEIEWVTEGIHEFAADYAAEHRLVENGYIVPVGARDGCCC